MANNYKPDPFITYQDFPFNGEPPLASLVDSFITPTPLFYVRTHGNIPEIDPAAYRLRIKGLVKQALVLSLDDLRSQFSGRRLAATLQCAGNRRREMAAVLPIPGETLWNAGAIGTAEWTGVPLRDVLQAAGLQAGAGHVAFLGLDEVKKGGEIFPFGGSIPLEKAMQPEVLLAYEMNGAPLEPAHGFPLRLVVPGYIGARSVKWLAEISVQQDASDNYYFSRGYQLYPVGVTSEKEAGGQGIKLGEFHVNSAICLPQEEARFHTGSQPVWVRGYAIAGGGRRIERVDVSADGGETWSQADFVGEPQTWAWRLWRLPLELKPGQTQLAVRAWDSAANTQAELVNRIWNFKGYMNNAWHRVNVWLEAA